MPLANRRTTTTVRRSRLRAALLCLLGVASSVGVGCQRAYYRAQADQEAYCIIDEKVVHAGEDPGEPLRIELDRRSRMFNPFDPDRPPMPLDDPRSHRYMHKVDGRRGYPLWHANGQTNAAESPDWWKFLPLDENGVLVLDADTSVQLALLHSSDYQEQLETLYLSALDVSSERFFFDTQFFGGAGASLTAEGRDIAGRGGLSSTRFETNRGLEMQRAFVTGATLVVGFANSIVWQLSGPDTRSSNTLIDFTLIQPLLRGAGRDRVMERLTFSERRLLANVRTFERYRRSFYLNITTGRQTESGVQRSQGFTGLGGGFGGFGGGAISQAGGFLGLLQDQLQIRNQEENVARLRESLLLLEDTLREQLTTIPDDQEAIPRQRLQIAQTRSQLFGANSQLLQSQNSFASSVDEFLVQLGLPPYLCVEIQDPLLNQFELITEELKSRRTEIGDLRYRVGEINTAILSLSELEQDPDNGLPRRRIDSSPELAALLADLRRALQPVAELRESLIRDDIPVITEDIERLSEAFPERRERAQRLAEIFERERDQICSLLPTTTIEASLFDLTEINELDRELIDAQNRLLQRIEEYGERIDQLDQVLATMVAETAADGTPVDGLPAPAEQAAPAEAADPEAADLTERLRDDVILASQNLLAELSDDILALQLIQARARTESVVLPEVDLTAPAAFEIAQENRRDLANARASLVDTWRLVEFNADDLESDLDLTFSGGIANGSNSPLDFRSSTGQLSVGLQWDAPLTRLQERNTYRQALIEFQQAKRGFYRAEDSIWQVLRGQLRQLRANQINFELQRQAVRIAADQISLNEDLRQLRDARGLSSGPTAARDIIFALNDLLNAQNSFLNVWVNYEVVRRNLDLDLGTMELTAEGLWIDPGRINPETVGSGTQDQGFMDTVDGLMHAPPPHHEAGEFEPIPVPPTAIPLILAPPNPIPPNATPRNEAPVIVAPVPPRNDAPVIVAPAPPNGAQ